MACDIIISGSGAFAARIAFDIAATARDPVSVVIAARNRTRLDRDCIQCAGQNFPITGKIYFPFC